MSNEKPYNLLSNVKYMYVREEQAQILTTFSKKYPDPEKLTDAATALVSNYPNSPLYNSLLFFSLTSGQLSACAQRAANNPNLETHEIQYTFWSPNGIANKTHAKDANGNAETLMGDLTYSPKRAMHILANAHVAASILAELAMLQVGSEVLPDDVKANLPAIAESAQAYCLRTMVSSFTSGTQIHVDFGYVISIDRTEEGGSLKLLNDLVPSLKGTLIGSIPIALSTTMLANLLYGHEDYDEVEGMLNKTSSLVDKLLEWQGVKSNIQSSDILKGMIEAGIEAKTGNPFHPTNPNKRSMH